MINEIGVGLTRILIVDDHPAVREALSMRISRQADLAIAGECATIDEALQSIADDCPDVAVVDLSLKNGNGLDLVKQINQQYGHVRILVWSMYDVALYGDRALRAGAMGYITKHEPTERVIDAVRQVRNGKHYYDADGGGGAGQLAGSDGTGDRNPSLIGLLSDRELEVFQYLGEGLDMTRIGERMQLSIKTVETYRARIKQKLNMTSRTELIRRAVEWVLQNR